MASVAVVVHEVALDQPDPVVARLAGLLDAGEAARVERLADPQARARRVVAAAATRALVAAAAGVADPAVLPISRRCAHCGHAEHGKPFLAGRPDVAFGVAHSGDRALVAVARAPVRIGVDVEVVRPRARLAALAARVLDDGAHARWCALAEADRLRAFYEAWTAKEAYLKAIGVGVTHPLRAVPPSPPGWTIAPLDAGPGAVAHLAVDAGDVTIARGRFVPGAPVRWSP